MATPQPPTLRPDHLTLFSHGVATLSLNANLPATQPHPTTLTFTPPTHHLNDILKTLTVSALNATVTSITYPLTDSNTGRGAEEAYLDLEPDEVLIDLLDAAIGTNISFTHPFQPNDPETSLFSSVIPEDRGVCSGTLVGVQDFEVRYADQKRGWAYTNEKYVLVQQASGRVRKLLLRGATDFTFHDDAINRRLTDALKRKRRRVATGETSIAITISPQEPRAHVAASSEEPQEAQTEGQSRATPDGSQVTVRYAVESPVYKLTHRLILPPTPESSGTSASSPTDEKISLQAWAIIDSPFSGDLPDVSVSLVAGKPMSFRHDLSSRRFMDRPEEKVDTSAGYGAPSAGSFQGKKYPKQLATKGARGGRSRITAGRSIGGSAPRGPGNDDDDSDLSEEEAYAAFDRPGAAAPRPQALSSVQGVDVVEVGDVYEYVIPHRVTLHANESALLPVISREIEGGKVLIYAPEVHGRCALSAVKIVNCTEATIEKGPVAVYEQDLLVGEGMLDTLGPGKRAFMAYAIDGSVTVQKKTVEKDGKVARVLYVNGWLNAVRWRERETKYEIENFGIGGKVMVLMHERGRAFEEAEVKVIREDEGATQTSCEMEGNVARYSLNIGEGRTEVRVVDRSEATRRYELESSCTADGIGMLLSGGVVSDAIAEKMRQVMKAKGESVKAKEEMRRLEEEVGVIERDQERYRKNLVSLGGVKEMNRFKEGSLMDRYVEDLQQSEDGIRRRRDSIKTIGARIGILGEETQARLLEITRLSVQDVL